MTKPKKKNTSAQAGSKNKQAPANLTSPRTSTQRKRKASFADRLLRREMRLIFVQGSLNGAAPVPVSVLVLNALKSWLTLERSTARSAQSVAKLVQIRRRTSQMATIATGHSQRHTAALRLNIQTHLRRTPRRYPWTLTSRPTRSRPTTARPTTLCPMTFTR